MGTSLNGLTPAATYTGLLKFGDNSAISASLKAVSDGAGNDSLLYLSTSAIAFGSSSNFYWDNTNSRLGIGTSSPTAPLHVVGGTYSPQGVTINAGTRFSTGGSDYGSDSLSSVGGGPMTLRAYYYTIINRANAGIAAQCLEIQGQTLIKGTGSTSATTSLLVQNSGGTDVLKMRDDGVLLLGTTASNLGVISVPHSSSYGERVFMGIQNGVNLFSTYSNDGLGFKANYNYFYGAIYNTSGTYGGAGSIGTGVGAHYTLSTGLNPYGGADQALISMDAGSRIQGGAYAEFIRIAPSLTIDNVNNKCWGIYFNPTLSGAYSNQNVFAFQSTYGGGYFNTTSVNASAILQADSTTQGFLPPRMTEAQILAIASPAVGLMAYNTDKDCPVFYSAAGWRKVSHSAM